MKVVPGIIQVSDYGSASESAAGPVTVERHLYRLAGQSSKSICLFTPRAARQGAFGVAHLTPREAAALFGEMGGETLPFEATVLYLSLDGVMVPVKEVGRVEKQSQPNKRASRPASYREAGCGTLSLYNARG